MDRKNFNLITAVLMMVISTTCTKFDREPKVESGAITDITTQSAVAAGNILDIGEGIINHGHCWSTSPNPLLSGYKASLGPRKTTGTFISNLTSLQPGTKYYIRAFAQNGEMVVYGNETSFTTIAIALPTVTTSAVTSITQTTALSGGNVTSDGGAEVTARGVCWSVSQKPTISDSRTIDGTGPGPFTSAITSLLPNTAYYIRAYATNSIGTAYGDESSFKTPFPNCGTVTDIDGNVYNTVIIGDQCWMQENLKTTRFNDGTEIRFVSNITMPFDEAPYIEFPANTAYCWYNFDPGLKNIYGALYNSKTTASGILCPVGWHVSTFDDWHKMLIIFDPDADAEYLRPSLIAGGALKATGTIEEGTGLWHYPNTGATNVSGFSALPGGYYRDNVFSGLGFFGSWWSAVDEVRSIGYSGMGVGADDTEYHGRSVRCVKDN